ncbi:MAG: glycosyltransferase, partial [Clostridia bacterium]|nr:glycosyltransferase [Clostridia bacterium]
MRVLMSGGGTGGHVNPAIAIANIIKKNCPDAVIEFVGTKRGIENKLVPHAGYKLHHIEIQGIRRSLSPSNIKTAFLAAKSFSDCKKIIKKFKPDVVIGTGGYACWPVVAAASNLKIPTVLHESNATPGFAIKMLDRAFVADEETA